ncbi:unnamed protein product, partial [Ilex paraguariensis]
WHLLPLGKSTSHHSDSLPSPHHSTSMPSPHHLAVEEGAGITRQSMLATRQASSCHPTKLACHSAKASLCHLVRASQGHSTRVRGKLLHATWQGQGFGQDLSRPHLALKATKVEFYSVKDQLRISNPNHIPLQIFRS